MRPRLLRASLILGLTIALPGCALLVSLFGEDPQQREQARAQQAEQLRVEFDAAKARAAAPGAGDAELLAYANAASAALQAGLEGTPSPEDLAALEAELDARIAASKDPTRRELALAEGTLFALTDRAQLSVPRYLELMRAAPDLEVFDALASIPASRESDAAMLESCALVRPLVGGEGIIALTELCLARADGDTSQLRWPEAEADLVALDAALVRRAEAEAKAAAEAEAAAAAAAEEAARTQATREKIMAATYAGGHCRFSNCPTEGWDTRTNEGTLESRCRFSNCLEDGWDTSLPSGGRAESRCRFSNCVEDGWDTRFPDGTTLEVRCRFSKCFEDGWNLELRGGESGDRGQASCRFSKCFEDGWSTQMNSGAQVDCSCRFSKCLEDGADCS